MSKVFLSIIIPVYNSELTLEETISKVREEIETVYNYEIILVNDSSSDNSHDVCVKLFQNDLIHTYVELSRNFGQHSALLAGIEKSQGDILLFMDDDLQTPPDEIKKIVEEILQNPQNDVVYAQYELKKHSFLRNIGSAINEKMAEKLISKPKNIKLSSFFAIKRFIANEMIRYAGPYPYIPGLVLRSTNRIGGVKVRHDSRQVGKSNYTLKKLFKLWLNGFTAFSITPLRVSSLMGAIIASLSFLTILALIIRKLIDPTLYLGWTSTMITLSMFGGIQLLSIGILGEYIGRTYLSINKTPAYVIRNEYEKELV